jgi:hypothetical protein
LEHFGKVFREEKAVVDVDKGGATFPGILKVAV